MGRKNKRRKQKPPLLPWNREPELNHGRGIAPHRSRCAFCGRPLPRSGWHWFRDEFGQRGRKCNDERSCMRRRKQAAEESFRRAIRRNAYHTGSYWMKEDRENGNE